MGRIVHLHDDTTWNTAPTADLLGLG
jgi:hypothetical protein